MFQKLKQFKDLRAKAKNLQKTLATEVVTGSAGFGKVKVTMDANFAIQNFEIDETLCTPSQKEKLKETCKEATNDAIKKAQVAMSKKLRASGDFDVNKLLGK